MPRYLLLVIFVASHMFTISLSDMVIEESNNPPVADLKETYLTRGRLPIFPKNTKKFVMTMKPHISTIFDHSPKPKTMTRMPIVRHLITLKPKTETITTTQLASRKPLMNLRTFTVKSQRNSKYSPTNKLANMKQDNSQPAKYTNYPTVSTLKTTIPDFYMPEESQKVQSVSTETKANNFSSEEMEDRNEFIFLENKNEKKEEVTVLLSDNNQDENVFETTTEFTETHNELRVKRSKNIIEEENLASTTSGLKYTGRDTKLVNYDVYFKNINS